MGWGCPDHPRQGLMYKTHDNKNTKSIKIQCIWTKKLKLKNWSLSPENLTHINSVWTERPPLHLSLDQAKGRSKLSLLKLKCSPSFQNASFAEKLYIKKRNTKKVIIFFIGWIMIWYRSNTGQHRLYLIMKRSWICFISLLLCIWSPQKWYARNLV